MLRRIFPKLLRLQLTKQTNKVILLQYIKVIKKDAHFVGNILLKRRISMVNTVDWAKDFDIFNQSAREPGSEMLLHDECNLHACYRPMINY